MVVSPVHSSRPWIAYLRELYFLLRISNEVNLFFRKRACFLAPYRNSTTTSCSLSIGTCRLARMPSVRRGDNVVIPFEVGRVPKVIRDVNDLLGRNRSHSPGFCAGHHWHISVRYAAVTCSTAHCAFFIQEQSCSIRSANPHYLVQYDIENTLQLSRRA